MSKYIDADKLIANLERQNIDKKVIEPVIRIITSLQQEQPEVGLEKELEQWRHEHFRGKLDGNYMGDYLERSSQLELARHFWNKGYNARKED